MQFASCRDRVAKFLFAPQPDDWLTVLRAGLAVQVLLYCFSIRADWNYLLAGTGRGLISRELSEVVLSAESFLIPRLGWLVAIGNYLGAQESTVLEIAWFALVSAACLLLIGLFSRIAAILTWFLHLSAVKSGALLAYGMDNFTTIGLFYLMVSPLPDRYSVDHAFRTISLKNPQLRSLFRRLLQLHLCIIYFFGGLAKSVGPGWWNGDSLWRALTRPPFNVIAPEALVRWKYFFPFLGISVWLIEIGYVVFIWPRRTRGIWLTCVILMHVAIGLTMGMYLFASIMIILNLAAFGPGLSRHRDQDASPASTNIVCSRP